jgi:hypothetical protein
VPDRGVTVEDLHQEDVDRGDGVEEALSPFMADITTNGEDGGSIEKSRGVSLEAVKDANNPVMHDVLPAEVASVYHLYDRKRYFVQLFMEMRVVSIRLMPFVSGREKVSGTNGTSLSENLYIAWLYAGFLVAAREVYIDEHNFNKPNSTCFAAK